MELKDWILLFVPIMFNGIIIWVFQCILQTHIERKEKFRDLQEGIFKIYIEKIKECIEINISINKNIANKNREKNEELMELFVKLDEKLMELYNYYQLYETVLSTNSSVADAYKNLKKRYEEWKANQENTQTQIAFLKDNKDILQNIMNESLKYIYGIKK